MFLFKHTIVMNNMSTHCRYSLPHRLWTKSLFVIIIIYKLSTRRVLLNREDTINYYMRCNTIPINQTTLMPMGVTSRVHTAISMTEVMSVLGAPSIYCGEVLFTIIYAILHFFRDRAHINPGYCTRTWYFDDSVRRNKMVIEWAMYFI